MSANYGICEPLMSRWIVVVVGSVAGVSHYGRGMRPLQTCLRVAGAAPGVCHRQRVERTVEIADVTGDLPGVLDRSPGLGLRLEYHDV